jgi:hypothetical protein
LLLAGALSLLPRPAVSTAPVSEVALETEAIVARLGARAGRATRRRFTRACEGQAPRTTCSEQGCAAVVQLCGECAGEPCRAWVLAVGDRAGAVTDADVLSTATGLTLRQLALYADGAIEATGEGPHGEPVSLSAFRRAEGALVRPEPHRDPESLRSRWSGDAFEQLVLSDVPRGTRPTATVEAAARGVCGPLPRVLRPRAFCSSQGCAVEMLREVDRGSDGTATVRVPACVAWVPRTGTPRRVEVEIEALAGADRGFSVAGVREQTLCLRGLAGPGARTESEQGVCLELGSPERLVYAVERFRRGEAWRYRAWAAGGVTLARSNEQDGEVHYDVPTLATAPVLDGDFDEPAWQRAAALIPFTLGAGSARWGGRDDLSVSWRAVRVRETLYFALEVRDDHFVERAAASSVLASDHVQLTVVGGVRLAVLLEPNGAVSMRQWRLESGREVDRPLPVSGHWQRHAQGYRLEWSLPLRQLGLASTSAEVGLQLYVADGDDGRTPKSLLGHHVQAHLWEDWPPPVRPRPWGSLR